MAATRCRCGTRPTLPCSRRSIRWNDGAANWIEANLPKGAKLGYDPWLHTQAAVERMKISVERAGGQLAACRSNPLDTRGRLTGESRWMQHCAGARRLAAGRPTPYRAIGAASGKLPASPLDGNLHAFDCGLRVQPRVVAELRPFGQIGLDPIRRRRHSPNRASRTGKCRSGSAPAACSGHRRRSPLFSISTAAWPAEPVEAGEPG